MGPEVWSPFDKNLRGDVEERSNVDEEHHAQCCHQRCEFCWFYFQFSTAEKVLKPVVSIVLYWWYHQMSHGCSGGSNSVMDSDWTATRKIYKLPHTSYFPSRRSKARKPTSRRFEPKADTTFSIHGCSELRKVETYLRDTDMTGLASAWAMARRRPKEYRRKVDAASRCSGVCPNTWPDLYISRVR